jgi:hypothetical protein
MGKSKGLVGIWYFLHKKIIALLYKAMNSSHLPTTANDIYYKTSSILNDQR